ncbi:MAG: TM0106 family RecB-like putative nuclease [Planctomycetes bacterium]|nr:TM0106 family RecB-like putative nuclease [Planctomycetota bacterium]
MVEEVDRYSEIKMQRGAEYEKQWVEKNYPDAIKIEEKWGLKALKQTMELMLKGTQVIYQPNLWLLSEEMYGKGDLLVRSDDAPSDLGKYHYRVIEIKRSKNLQDYHSFQAVCYNKMLEAIQGYASKEVTVVLKEGRENVAYNKKIIDKFNHYVNLWKQIRDGKNKPIPGKMDSTESPWRVYANKILKDSMDLTLLYNVGAGTRPKLQKKINISSIKDLYSFKLEKLVKELGQNQGTRIYYNAQAYKHNKPIIEPGVKLSIPRGKRNFYFDFETSDAVHPTEPPHVYLIGVWDESRDKFVYFLGKGVRDETKIFRQFIDYLGNYENDCLYHWYSFETGTMKKVITRHPELTTDLNNLMKRCVDLMDVLKKQVYMPAPTYSIKHVAPALGFNWRQKEVGAFESMVLYWEYLKDGDKNKINKVLKYNEDDCLAMVHIDRNLCHEFGQAGQ